jgi:hypothetical protein
MRKFAFSAATVLAVCGIFSALNGVMGNSNREGEKSLIIGLVLILGSGVFAILSLGIRGRMD